MKRKGYLLKSLAIISMTVIFCLVILPLALVSFYPDKEEQSLPEAPPRQGSMQTPDYINVYRTATNKVEAIPFEDYVMGVVAGEMPASFEMEALKAQAVAARTYSLSKYVRGNPEDHPSAPVCDDIHCQVYRSPEELKQIKSAEWMATGWPKIQVAVTSTKGQLMYYQGALVEQPLFHSSSGGKTENSEDVFVSALPYLRSVDSPYEAAAPHQKEQAEVSLSEFKDKIKKANPGAKLGTISSDTVKVIERSQGGRVISLQIGNITMKGRDIRNLFGLRSANFTVSVQGDTVLFTTDGYGHGVGMSQYGANGMAQAGYNYSQILMHYYTGVEVY